MVPLLHNNPATAAAQVLSNGAVIALRCCTGQHTKQHARQHARQHLGLYMGLIALPIVSLAQSTPPPDTTPAIRTADALHTSTPHAHQVHVPRRDPLSRTGAHVIFSVTLQDMPAQDLLPDDSAIFTLTEKNISDQASLAPWQLNPLEPTEHIEQAFSSHQPNLPSTPEQLQNSDSLSINTLDTWSSTPQRTPTTAAWRTNRWARGVFANDAELLTPFAKGNEVVSWTLSDSITLAGVGSRRVWDPRDRSFVVSAEAGFFITPATDFQLGYQLLETSMREGVQMPDLSSDALFARFQLRF